MSLLQNLLHGAGTVLAISPRTPIRRNKYFVQSGSASEAIKKDFERVGYDLWKVIDEQKESKPVSS